MAAASYRVEDNRLTISGPSGRELLAFARAEQPESAPLLATEWHLARYTNGSGSTVASPVPGTDITLSSTATARSRGGRRVQRLLGPLPGQRDGGA